MATQPRPWRAYAHAALQHDRKDSAMTAQEQAAFAAGIQAARQAAMTVAVTIEVRDDARELRQQAAAAALHGFAAGLKAAFLDPPEATS